MFTHKHNEIFEYFMIIFFTTIIITCIFLSALELKPSLKNYLFRTQKIQSFNFNIEL